MSGGAVGAMVLPPVAQRSSTHLGGGTPCLGSASMCSCSVFRSSPLRPRAARVAPALPKPTRRVGARGIAFTRISGIVAVLFFGSLGQNGAIIHLSSMLTDRGYPGRERRPGYVRPGRGEPAGRLRRDGCSTGSSDRASRCGCSRRPRRVLSS